MVKIENNVDKNTACEAKHSLDLYSLAKIAVLLAAGIADITIGIDSSISSVNTFLSRKNIIKGINMSRIKDKIYRFLLEKHSIADDEESILPITNIEIGVVTLPNNSIGLLINIGNRIFKQNRIRPKNTDIITGLTSVFIEKM